MARVRSVVVLVSVICGGSCAADEDGIRAGAVAAAYRAAIADRFPKEIVEGSPRFFMAHNRDPAVRVPAGLSHSLGLPVIAEGHVPDSLTPTLLVNYYLGSVEDQSAIDVTIELLVLDSGPWGFHGPDYRFVVDCTESCKVVEHRGRGYLN